MTGYQVMPPLAADEYADLEQSIKANGVLVPVVVSTDGEIIDGHHRAEIADRLGVPYGSRVVHGEPTALRTLAYSLNLHRRHFSRDQRRELIAQSVRQDPQLADREHARRMGADHKTVGAVRDGLEATGEVPQSDTRVSGDGRLRPATQPNRPAPDPEPSAASPFTGDPLFDRIRADVEAAEAAEQLAADDEKHREQAENATPNPALTDWVNSSQAVQDSGYVLKFLKAAVRANDYLGFDPERLALLLDQNETDAVYRNADSVTRFAETFRRARSGLRVIQGGTP